MQPLCPSDLGLILSYQCQSSCAHCIYNCSPMWKDWMPETEVRAAFEAMRYWRHPFQVHLTGGEPFLKYDLLKRAVEIAIEMQIPCYLETNAGWCVNESVAEDRFHELRQAGLMAVLISLSPFHAETIPLKRTMQVVLAAQKVFGIQRVFVYQHEWLQTMQQFGEEIPVPLEKYDERFGRSEAGEMFWHGYGLIAGGRSAYRLGVLTGRKAADHFKGQNCRQELLFAPHSHFDLYGNILPGFCGGLSLGDWHEFSKVISDLSDGRYSELIGLLIRSGPYALYEMAERDFSYQPAQEGYVAKCHLCVDVRRHLVKTGIFPELSPRAFYENF